MIFLRFFLAKSAYSQQKGSFSNFQRCLVCLSKHTRYETNEHEETSASDRKCAANSSRPSKTFIPTNYRTEVWTQYKPFSRPESKIFLGQPNPIIHTRPTFHFWPAINPGTSLQVRISLFCSNHQQKDNAQKIKNYSKETQTSRL